MQAEQPSRTARQNALFRALDARRPAATRVADDPLAVRFLSPEYRLLAELARVPPLLRAIEAVIDRRWPCARSGVVVRTRLLDETIVTQLPLMEQVLLLGAGFDSRPYRLPGMEAVRIFEVDHPSTQAAKRSMLRRGARELPVHVSFVPVVFGRDDPAQALAAAGFAPDAQTLVVWEGVTNYLEPRAVDATFRFLSSSVGTRSPVLFTYVHRGILDGSAAFEGAETTLRAVRRVGEPFTFGLDPVEVPAYLAARGFELVWDVPVSEAAARFEPPGRRPPAPAYYHVVEARRS
jgi:methyltransferase (TIGR00027 family)